MHLTPDSLNPEKDRKSVTGSEVPAVQLPSCRRQIFSRHHLTAALKKRGFLPQTSEQGDEFRDTYCCYVK